MSEREVRKKACTHVKKTSLQSGVCLSNLKRHKAKANTPISSLMNDGPRETETPYLLNSNILLLLLFKYILEDH